MSKWLRIFCIGIAFMIAGFFLYRTTDGGTGIEVIHACLWFITGVINCMTLYEMAQSDGKIEILDIMDKVVEKTFEDMKQKIKELEESEVEDDLE